MASASISIPSLKHPPSVFTLKGTVAILYLSARSLGISDTLDMVTLMLVFLAPLSIQETLSSNTFSSLTSNSMISFGSSFLSSVSRVLPVTGFST